MCGQLCTESTLGFFAINGSFFRSSSLSRGGGESQTRGCRSDLAGGATWHTERRRYKCHVWKCPCGGSFGAAAFHGFAGSPAAKSN